MKGSIDKVTGGKVQFGAASYAFVSQLSGKYIRYSDGELINDLPGSIAYVAEYSLSKPGREYSITYYDLRSTQIYTVAWYNSSGSVIGGIRGSGSGSGASATVRVTMPSDAVTVRIYGRTGYNIASMEPIAPEGIMNMVEIMVRRPGTSASQVVWPAEERYVISSVTVRYTDRNGAASTFIPAAGGYATATGTIEVYRGTRLIRTITSALTVDAFASNNYRITSWNGDQVDQFVSLSDSVYGQYLATNNVARRSISVRWTYQNLAYINAYTTQEANNIIRSNTTKRYTSLSFSLSQTDLQPSGGTVTGRIDATYTSTTEHTWSSGDSSYTYGSGIDENVTPAYITSDPLGVQDDWPSLTIPANTGTSDKNYTINADFSGLRAQQIVTVLSSGSVPMTITSLTLVDYYYAKIEDGLGNNMIPASGNIGDPIYPVVTIRATTSTGITLTGNVDGGETSTVLSNGSTRVNATITYLQNGSTDSSNGRVEVQSRGTTVDSGNTVARSGLNVRITAGSKTATNPSDITVYQQRNQLIEHRDSSFIVSSLTCTPKFGSSTGNTLPVQDGSYRLSSPVAASVYLDVRVTGQGVTEYFRYTAVTIGGTYEQYSNAEVAQNAIQNFSVVGNGSAVQVVNKVFSAENIHTLSEKSYTCSGSYQGTQFSIGIQQAADAKIPGEGTPYVSIALLSNDLIAGGGYVDIVATAYSTAGKVWASDGMPVSGEGSITDNTGSILIELTQSSQGAFPSVTPIAVDTTAHTKTFRIAHRDMTNNVTIDSLSVVAKNGTTQSSALQYSVSNALETTEYEEEGEVSWGGSYPLASNYGVSLTLADFTSPDSPAPFTGGTTTYAATAYHDVSDYHDGTVPINTYRRYTSWSAEKDDAYHKELVSTTYDTQKYRGVVIPGSTRRITTDGLSITGPSWVSIDTSAKVITVNEQGDNDARNATIIATNTSDPNMPKAKSEVTIYQAKFSDLAVSPSSLIFEPTGGSQTFNIDYIRTNWAITHSGQGNDDPITLVTPTSGGGSRGTQIVTVSVAENNTDMPQFAEILVSPIPANPDVLSKPIDVYIKTATVHYDYIGWAQCSWVSSNKIRYELFIQNRKSGIATFQDVSFRIRSTANASADPSTGQSERSVYVGTVSVPGGDTITKIANGEISMPTRDSSRFYYSILEHAKIHSDYWPFEEMIDE